MHTHILLFGSKFHILLAMYVQVLDKYIENIEKIENIKNIGYFRYFRKYHDIFQPCKQSLKPVTYLQSLDLRGSN